MICIHVVGDSMFPVIASGSIVAVDMHIAERNNLAGKIVLASHRDLGFKIARLQRLPSADILVSTNHQYAPLDITNDPQWKIVGHVLWWTSRDQDNHAT
jgi:phage repressor protein C with HTH and peptisase S24 domain